MTEEMEKIKQWKYNFAWKQLENAQLENERLDNKAMSVINSSSLLIPIITGILFFTIKNSMGSVISYVLLVGAVVFLVGSIFFAFMVIWLKDQGVIRTKNQFSKIGNDNISKILKNTAVDLATWQEKVVDAGIKKGEFLIRSNRLFAVALGLLGLGAVHLLFTFLFLHFLHLFVSLLHLFSSLQLYYNQYLGFLHL